MKALYSPVGKLVLAASALNLLVSPCLAYAPDGDLMKIKGYSPEVIQTANQQRSRQEWKEPSVQTKSTTEQFFHNIYYGNWMGPLDDFGSEVIRKN
ncbi:hypothetical protein EMOOHJMP_00118 [Microcystis phage MaAM05]|nr:hypothetical protein EMOOHJMP_00118 [Microcystis phage MaAM05]